MSRATVCFSIYSDISRRTRFASSSNKVWAKALANSVFPTPVGPKNKKDPIGRLGSLIPDRARRTASATTLTPSSCPTTRRCKNSSSFKSFSISPWRSRLMGIPVHRLTTSAISSSSTSSFKRRLVPCFWPRCSSSDWSSRSNRGSVP